MHLISPADVLPKNYINMTSLGNTLVIEYGVVEDAEAVFEPPGGGPGNKRLNIQSLPIPALNNRRASLTVGMTVGGSSTINGQFFDRGHKLDYDDWAKIGSPEFDESEESWDWDNILPFFKKVRIYIIPTPSLWVVMDEGGGRRS